jgi:hypothetical protein
MKAKETDRCDTNLPDVWYQLHVAVGGNGEAYDTGTADSKDVAGTVSRAGGRPAAAAAAAAVDTEGTEDEGQEVWVEEGQSEGVGCLSQALNLGDIVDRDLVILEAA